MASLAGTQWAIYHPHPNGMKFNEDNTCVYGGIFNGTYTEDGDSWTANVSHPGFPDVKSIDFNGTHSDGEGGGVMTTNMDVGPPNQSRFTMKKSPGF